MVIAPVPQVCNSHVHNWQTEHGKWNMEFCSTYNSHPSSSTPKIHIMTHVSQPPPVFSPSFWNHQVSFSSACPNYFVRLLLRNMLTVTLPSALGCLLDRRLPARCSTNHLQGKPTHSAFKMVRPLHVNSREPSENAWFHAAQVFVVEWDFLSYSYFSTLTNRKYWLLFYSQK